MEELLRLRLSATSTAYITAEGISRAKLGDLILNDNTFFRRVLEDEQGFTVRTYDRVMRWLADNWPSGLGWPADVPHPDQAPFAARPAPESARASL